MFKLDRPKKHLAGCGLSANTHSPRWAKKPFTCGLSATSNIYSPRWT